MAAPSNHAREARDSRGTLGRAIIATNIINPL